MSDRDTLITAIDAEIRKETGEGDEWAGFYAWGHIPHVLDAIDRLGYRVVGPAEQAVLDAADALAACDEELMRERSSIAQRRYDGAKAILVREVEKRGDAIRARGVAGSTNQEPRREDSR